MTLSPKNLVLDLLSTIPAGHAVPVGALVRAGAILDVGDNSLRVALTRLRAHGLVESAGRGHYRLGSAAAAIDHRVRSWYSLEDEVGRWDGSWLATERLSERGDQRGASRMLRLLGFRPLSATLQLRPGNLAGGAEGVRGRLTAIEPDDATMVFQMSDLDADNDAAARALWDGRALERQYAAMIRKLDLSTRRLDSLPAERAMAETFLLGGEAVRMIVNDPLLPSPIVDTAARRKLVTGTRRYHRLGLRAWKGWAGESIKLNRGAHSAWRHSATGGNPA